MALELRGYIDFTDYKSMQYVAKKGQSLPDAPSLILRDATDAESGRIVGEAFRLGGHTDEARLALIAPYIRGERDARLLAALGLAERLEGKNARARTFLEAAAQAKVERPRAYFELARLNFEEAASSDAPFTDAQVARIIGPLNNARQQRPPMVQVYGLLAALWAQAARSPTREEFTDVIEGVQRFPRSTALVWRTAMLAAQRNFSPEALALARHGMKISRDPADRNRFETLVHALERDAVPPLKSP
jgi:hypothetical protein